MMARGGAGKRFAILWRGSGADRAPMGVENLKAILVGARRRLAPTFSTTELRILSRDRDGEETHIGY
jgi:hypothetical protein